MSVGGKHRGRGRARRKHLQVVREDGHHAPPAPTEAVERVRDVGDLVKSLATFLDGEGYPLDVGQEAVARVLVHLSRSANMKRRHAVAAFKMTWDQIEKADKEK